MHLLISLVQQWYFTISRYFNDNRLYDWLSGQKGSSNKKDKPTIKLKTLENVINRLD